MFSILIEILLSLLKTMWDKEEMLATSIFSFSRIVFCSVKDRFYHLSYLYNLQTLSILTRQRFCHLVKNCTIQFKFFRIRASQDFLKLIQCFLNVYFLPFPKRALVFTCLQYKPIENTAEKEKLLVTSNFSVSHSVFNSWGIFCNSHQIRNCCLLTLFVWKSLNICGMGKGKPNKILD